MTQISTFYSKLQETVSEGKWPHVVESGEGAYLTIQGRKKLNFCSSHYLGLATDPRLVHAASSAAKEYGIGTGYRTLAGTHKLHLELENAISKFKNTEAAVVFSSAYMANAAAVQTILGKEDIVISDELNHASIIDAIKLAGVKNKFIYKHADTKDLEERLKEVQALRKTPKSNGETPLALIITDGVFSMDGDLAPLPQIAKLAKEYDVLTMVDDAHGEGVLGKGGRGIVDHFGLLGEVDIEVGSLSKAFSVMGGFIAGKKTLIDFYMLKARQRLFSIALTIPDTAAALKAIEILLESDAPVVKLWNNVKYLQEGFKKLGFNTGNSQTPIIPVMIGSEETAREFSAKLFAMDIFATPILFPMVAQGKARIRVIASASFEKEDMDKGLEAFEKVGKELKII